MRCILRTLACLVILVACVWAQNSGSITGTVHDATGAVIPGATVVVTSVEKGTSISTKTNGQGDYLVGALPPGHYNVTITQTGFKQFKLSEPVVLDVGSKAKVDATLEVGEMATQVSVEGAAVQVQTETPEMSSVVTGKEVTQIVLNGRDFAQLVTLAPGVSNQTGQDEGTVGVYGNVVYSINGGRTENNNWELDGGDNMDNGSNQTLNVYPSVDAIGEFRVMTSNYGAQYGRNASGTIETSIKSGTKDFHGDVYEFLRNNDFNARNFFQPTVPEYRKNDYGYTLGGPVTIPGVYNKNRDKTFFFFSEEWRKELVPGQTFSQPLPSAQEQQGNFADVCPAPGSAVNKTGFPDCPVNPKTGAYFPNNIVPIDPNAQAIISALLPQPNFGSGLSSRYNAAPAQDTNWREELVRIDHNFSDKVRFFGHFIHDSWSTETATPLWGNGASFPSVGTNFVGPGVSGVANLATNFSPTLLNEFTFGYTTDHIFLNAVGPAQRPSGMTMTGIFNNGFGGLLPAVSVGPGVTYDTGGFLMDSGYFPWNNANPTYTYKDQVSKIIGSHNLLFGGYFVAAQKNEFATEYVQGILYTNITSPVSTGNAFADLLQGDFSQVSQANSKIKYYNRYKIFEPYLQDDWHVTPRLTLNLGLRISMFGTYREKYYQAYNFNPVAYSLASAPQIDATGSVTGFAGSLIPGTGSQFDGIQDCGKDGTPRGCVAGHLFNPAPRIGFAYDPFGDGKTSIRGGYGIFFEHTNGNEGNTEGLEGSPPLVLNSTQYNITGYTNIGGGGGVAPAFPLALESIPNKAMWPYMQQWNISVQREVIKNSVLTVAYVGSKGTHLADTTNINQLYPISAAQNPFLPGEPLTQADCSSGLVNGVAPTGPAATQFAVACGADADPYRPYRGLGVIKTLRYGANSSYNAMQVSFVRHAGRLNIDLAYTWSHSLDNASDYGATNFVNSYNLGLTRASSDFDQRQILTVGYVYDLPLFTQKGWLHATLGGWQWSGLTTWQTGTPFSVTDALYGAGVGNGGAVATSTYLDPIGNPNSGMGALNNQPGVYGPLLYNPAAFAAPQGLTFGTGQRNILNNPSRTNFDMGLHKKFLLPGESELRYFEFRAEAFNVFNHTEWLPLGGPLGVNGGGDATTACFAGSNNSPAGGTCLQNSDFLRPAGAHNPRILQLALKFFF